MKTKLKKKDKIGILGGTFDPPHFGHVFISKVALKKLKLKKIIWVITKQNPFKKKPHLNKKIRIKLSKNILGKEKKIVVKYLDNLTKSNNTYDLLNYLVKKNKNTKFFFLMGADSFVKFHKWYNWKKIPRLAKLIIFARSNYFKAAINSIASKKLNKKDWQYINSKMINISSSLIRKF